MNPLIPPSAIRTIPRPVETAAIPLTESHTHQQTHYADLLESTRYRWKLALAPSALESSRLSTLDLLVERRRAQLTQEFEATFAERPLHALPDPSLLLNMNRAAERVAQAFLSNETVVIFGDYDVDGTVSCSMLRRFLGEYGLHPLIYIPNRLTEGYGLNVKGVESVALKGARVIVTVDNGISARDACARAQELGIDVIVTDHHEPPDELPKAFAIINPKQPGCSFPYKDLAGVGVAYFFLIALRRALAQSWPDVRPNLRHYLDYVAVGTIADVCPLTGLNHLLTRVGLAVLDEHLRMGRRPGLAALLRVAGVDPAAQLSSEQIAFQVGPRLNAAGRLGAARATEEILSTADLSRAEDLAHQLDSENRSRRELERQTFRELCARIENSSISAEQHTANGIVAYEPGWHPGVLGIVASRCVERFYTPSLVLCAHDGCIKGSGRSTDEINLFELLAPHRSGFLAFGGHAKAVGFSLLPDRIDWLRDTLARSLAEGTSGIAHARKPTLKIDAEIPLYSISTSLVESLSQLEPFGSGNQRPRFLVSDVTVEDCQPIGKNSADGHCRIHLSQHGQVCAVPFTGFALREALEEAARAVTGGPRTQREANCGQLHVVVELSFGYWKGHRKLELRICDFAAAPGRPALEIP
jgi:single-stranded-DNA-specific exonuclease